ncbi:four helix bundle protein [Fodinibius salsisoli]|uniref:Four helix bundle protein n=1 Tax=Fodinibius salsisoli TaxID=2820877 RepID=A0ABT3PJS8_9BACT|nr:four helix bundle protein [Fodinibius salsisoli]MCW9706152.1 four helix bundle protein [Fodinibius salsisoli]
MHKLSELQSWKSGRKLRRLISELVKSLPGDEKFRLKDQIIRSSRSVPANIAEGFGRYHYQENIQFCRTARGSLYETQEHLICALDEGFINEDQFNNVNEQLLLCLKILNGYIAYLKKSKNDSKNK